MIVNIFGKQSNPKPKLFTNTVSINQSQDIHFKSPLNFSGLAKLAEWASPIFSTDGALLSLWWLVSFSQLFRTQNISWTINNPRMCTNISSIWQITEGKIVWNFLDATTPIIQHFQVGCSSRFFSGGHLSDPAAYSREKTIARDSWLVIGGLRVERWELSRAPEVTQSALGVQQHHLLPWARHYTRWQLTSPSPHSMPKPSPNIYTSKSNPNRNWAVTIYKIYNLMCYPHSLIHSR